MGQHIPIPQHIATVTEKILGGITLADVNPMEAEERVRHSSTALVGIAEPGSTTTFTARGAPRLHFVPQRNWRYGGLKSSLLTKVSKVFQLISVPREFTIFFFNGAAHLLRKGMIIMET